MADEIKFYSSTEELPDIISNGNIYFILKEDDSAALVVDLNNQRYTVNPSIPLAGGSVEKGLISNTNANKLNKFQVETGDNVINIAPTDSTIGNVNFNLAELLKVNDSPVLTQNNLSAVEVIPRPEGEDDSSYIEVVKNETGDKFILRLHLAIPTGPQGAPGPKGQDGVNGEDGKDAVLSAEAANVSIGTNEQEGPNAVANFVKNENDEYVFNLNLYNIKGEQGEQGERGPAGEIIPIEFVFHNGTSTSPDDTNPDEDKELETFWVDNVMEIDEEGNKKIVKKIYHVVVPRGRQGDKGDKGDQGSQGPQGEAGAPGGFQGEIEYTGSGNVLSNISITEDENLSVNRISVPIAEDIEQAINDFKEEGFELEFDSIDVSDSSNLPQLISKIEKEKNEQNEVVYKIYKATFAATNEESSESDEESEGESEENEIKTYLIGGREDVIFVCEVKEGVLQSKNGNLSFDALSKFVSVVDADKPEDIDIYPQKLQIL